MLKLQFTLAKWQHRKNSGTTAEKKCTPKRCCVSVWTRSFCNWRLSAIIHCRISTPGPGCVFPLLTKEIYVESMGTLVMLHPTACERSIKGLMIANLQQTLCTEELLDHCVLASQCIVYLFRSIHKTFNWWKGMRIDPGLVREGNWQRTLDAWGPSKQSWPFKHNSRSLLIRMYFCSWFLPSMQIFLNCGDGKHSFLQFCSNCAEFWNKLVGMTPGPLFFCCFPMSHFWDICPSLLEGGNCSRQEDWFLGPRVRQSEFQTQLLLEPKPHISNWKLEIEKTVKLTWWYR